MNPTAKEQKVAFLLGAARDEANVALLILADPTLTLEEKGLEMLGHAQLGFDYTEAADSLIPPTNPRLFTGEKSHR